VQRVEVARKYWKKSRGIGCGGVLFAPFDGFAHQTVQAAHDT
jgi:hypothetical protein